MKLEDVVRQALLKLQTEEIVSLTSDELEAYTSEFEMGFYLQKDAGQVILYSDYDRVAEPEYTATEDRFEVEGAVVALRDAMESHKAWFEENYKEE